jgi:hypothetical protein
MTLIYESTGRPTDQSHNMCKREYTNSKVAHVTAEYLKLQKKTNMGSVHCTEVLGSLLLVLNAKHVPGIPFSGPL